MGALVAGFANPIVHLFNRQADAEVLEIGIFCIRMQCLVLVSHAVNSVVNMFYAGIGMAGRSLAVNLTRQGYCFFPALLIAPKIWGINGVASTQAIADVLSLIVVIPLGISAFRMITRKEQEDESNGNTQTA